MKLLVACIRLFSATVSSLCSFSTDVMLSSSLQPLCVVAVEIWCSVQWWTTSVMYLA